MKYTRTIAVCFAVTVVLIAVFCLRGGPWWAVIVLAILAGMEAAPLTLATWDKLRERRQRAR